MLSFAVCSPHLRLRHHSSARYRAIEFLCSYSWYSGIMCLQLVIHDCKRVRMWMCVCVSICQRLNAVCSFFAHTFYSLCAPLGVQPKPWEKANVYFTLYVCKSRMHSSRVHTPKNQIQHSKGNVYDDDDDSDDNGNKKYERFLRWWLKTLRWFHFSSDTQVRAYIS